VFPAIVLNGVWCAQEAGDKLLLRQEIRELELQGRKLYMAFDADAATNPSVRHASIRLFLLLNSVRWSTQLARQWMADSAQSAVGRRAVIDAPELKRDHHR
jgi:hypothetical protein